MMNETHPNKAYKFYREILKSPKFVIAPMVDLGNLSFRLLCRNKGATLSYTPMLHSKTFVRCQAYRNHHFETCPLDRPCVAQFCGDDPAIMLQAAQMIQDNVDAIDINFGCPQKIARKGHYGAYLLEEWDVMRQLVTTLSQNLHIPVFCKIRLLLTKTSSPLHIEHDVERTIELSRKLQEWGCQLLTIHGRSILEIGDKKPHGANWDAIRQIKRSLSIPVIANGGINYHEDVEHCLAATGCDAVMVGNALLRNPALFTKNLDRFGQIDLAFEYLDIIEELKTPLRFLKGNIIKMTLDATWKWFDIRQQISNSRTSEDVIRILSELRQRLQTNAPKYTHRKLKQESRKKEEEEEEPEEKKRKFE